MADIEKLSNVQLVSLFSEDERSLFAQACDSLTAAAGQVIFNEGDPGDMLYLLVSGRVQILKRIAEGQDEMLPIVFPGDIFGEMTFLDGTPRSSSAMALDPCGLLTISRSRFEQLLQDKPAMAAKIFQQMSCILTGRLRATSDRVKDCIQWNLEISGASALGIQHLITTKIHIELELANGKRLTGQILLVVNTELGYQVTLKDQFGRLFIIPYASINYIAVVEEDYKRSLQD